MKESRKKKNIVEAGRVGLKVLGRLRAWYDTVYSMAAGLANCRGQKYTGENCTSAGRANLPGWRPAKKIISFHFTGKSTDVHRQFILGDILHLLPSG